MADEKTIQDEDTDNMDYVVTMGDAYKQFRLAAESEDENDA